MPTILFNSSSGRNFSKKRKRMPGTDMTLKPEMKVYDGFRPGSGADVFGEHIWTNLVSLDESPDERSLSWTPFTIDPPLSGTGVNQRIGSKYVLRFLKFKGYITLYKRCPMPVSWRLVLYRHTDATAAVLSRSGYLDFFSKKVMNVPDDTQEWKEWTIYNYYMKVLRSDVSSEFRRKVIASGTLPAGSQVFKYDFNPSKKPFNTAEDFGGSEALFVPVDVSVQVNDLIDPDTTRYGIVIETDNGVGYDIDSVARDTPDITLNVADQVFELQIFCKAYFQDP